jgi:hypothetical protein
MKQSSNSAATNPATSAATAAAPATAPATSAATATSLEEPCRFSMLYKAFVARADHFMLCYCTSVMNISVLI